MQNLYVVDISVWLVLFWGGAIMPAAMGLVISAVPENMRAFSSAMSQMAFNVFGYVCSNPKESLYLESPYNETLLDRG